MSPKYKPCLLHETAEIALTELKRFLEPRLMETFQLRRVSAPLYLPAGSPLLDSRYPGAKVFLAGSDAEIEIVGSLDLWLRRQLRRYDAADGFGVFTIMNALRPNLVPGPATTVHIAAWAWQQALSAAKFTPEALALHARTLYNLLVEAEQRIIEMFPHLHRTLHKNIDILSEVDLNRMLPDRTRDRQIYEYLHPNRAERDDNPVSDGRHCAALFVSRGNGSQLADGEMWVWNRRISRPLLIADISLWMSDEVGPNSIGGNIYRNQLAMQLLHQDSVE